LARDLLGGIGAALPEIAPGKNWLRHAALPERLRFVESQSLFPAHLKARLMSPALAAAAASGQAGDPVERRARLLERAPGDSLARLLYYDTATYLPLDILTKVDRMTMACSLEARPPLLDHHLVEAVFAMPSALKLEGAAQKRVMKRAVSDLVPRPILAREKQGFGVPIRKWFRGPLREALADVLTDGRSRARGWLQPTAVRALLDEHLSGRRDQSVRLWSLLMLELWSRRFLDQPGRASASSTEERASVASLGAAHE
jgi:asparagine synthase (glutamine-hydrolysing)